MAQLIIDIPDAVAPRVAAAFIALYGGDPGATAAQQRAFVKQQLIQHIRATVRAHEVAQATIAARDAAAAAAEAEINPT